jgi:hypothetical protein
MRATPTAEILVIVSVVAALKVTYGDREVQLCVLH